MTVADNRCSYAFPGTYGHECGREGVTVAVLPSERTRSGLYYAARCASCRDQTGRDNWGVLRFEDPGQPHQTNEWR